MNKSLTPQDQSFWENAAVAALSGILSNSNTSLKTGHDVSATDAGLFADGLLAERNNRMNAQTGDDPNNPIPAPEPDPAEEPEPVAMHTRHPVHEAEHHSAKREVEHPAKKKH